MKRKYDSDWTTEGFSTDTGTSYSAIGKHAKQHQKKHKWKKARHLDRQEPIVQELLYTPRERNRVKRLKAKHGPLMARPSYHAPTVTSSGSDWNSDDAISVLRALGDSAEHHKVGRAVGGLVGLAAAGPSGAVVGENIGALAAAGYTLYNLRNKLGPFYPKKQMVSGGTKKATQAAVNRSTMAMSGKSKLKQAKKVKVSPYLKAAIKKVNQGAAAKGFYQRSFNGVIGSLLGNGTVDYAQTATTYDSGTQIAIYGGAKGTHGDPKTWFSHLASQVFTTGALVESTVRANSELNFFTPWKIWHAASVLFNGKAEVANPYSVVADNLRTEYGPTGVIATGTVPGALKLNVLHSKVDFTMKNLSTRTLEVEIYECQPTLKFNGSTPLQDMYNTYDTIQDSSTLNKIVGYFADAQNLTVASKLFVEGTVDGVAIAKQNGWHWNYVKRSMILQPQEVCVHSMKGPSGELDFKKLVLPASAGTSQYSLTGLKNWTKHVMISVRVDPVLLDASAGTPTFSNNGQRWIQYDDTTGALHSPVAIQCTESFRISVPEIAGFITKPEAVVAGLTVGGQEQTLNFRKDRIQITNLVNDSTHPADVRVVVAREENPTASVIGSYFS